MTDLILSHAFSDEGGNARVAFGLAPDAADRLDEFMEHLRYFYIVTGDPIECGRTPEGVVSYQVSVQVPVTPKGETA
jgi:hypothetical protein